MSHTKRPTPLTPSVRPLTPATAADLPAVRVLPDVKFEAQLYLELCRTRELCAHWQIRFEKEREKRLRAEASFGRFRASRQVRWAASKLKPIPTATPAQKGKGL
jgi:hypothetical protein